MDLEIAEQLFLSKKFDMILFRFQLMMKYDQVDYYAADGLPT